MQACHTEDYLNCGIIQIAPSKYLINEMNLKDGHRINFNELTMINGYLYNEITFQILREVEAHLMNKYKPKITSQTAAKIYHNYVMTTLTKRICGVPNLPQKRFDIIVQK